MDNYIKTRPIASGLAEVGNGQINQEKLQQDVSAALNSCVTHIKNLLNSRNIHIPPAIQLNSSLDGRIVVVSRHPELAEIEALLNTAEPVLESFKETEILHRLLHLNSTEADETFYLGLTSLGGIAFFTETAQLPDAKLPDAEK